LLFIKIGTQYALNYQNTKNNNNKKPSAKTIPPAVEIIIKKHIKNQVCYSITILLLLFI